MSKPFKIFMSLVAGFFLIVVVYGIYAEMTVPAFEDIEEIVELESEISSLERQIGSEEDPEKVLALKAKLDVSKSRLAGLE